MDDLDDVQGEHIVATPSEASIGSQIAPPEYTPYDGRAAFQELQNRGNLSMGEASAHLRAFAHPEALQNRATQVSLEQPRHLHQTPVREREQRAESSAPRLDIRNLIPPEPPVEEFPAELPAELPEELPVGRRANPPRSVDGGRIYRESLEQASWFGRPLMANYERRTNTPAQRRQNRDLQDRLRALRERELSRWEESLLEINGNALTPESEDEEIRWLMAHERYQAALAEMDCARIPEPLDRPRVPAQPPRDAAQHVKNTPQTSRGVAQPVRETPQTSRGAS